MARSADEEAVQGIKDKKARKEAYYTRQRQNASAGSATQKKIQGKLSWGDSVRGFAKDQMQKIKASGPYSIPGARTEEAAGAGVKALGKGVSSLAKKGEGAMEDYVQRLRKPTPVKKALGSSKTALGSSERASMPSPKSGTKSISGGSRKAVSGKSQKALGTSGQWQYEKELAGQSAKKMPSNPKTFNRNGTARAEGRQKSTRNPVSKRKSVND